MIILLQDECPRHREPATDESCRGLLDVGSSGARKFDDPRELGVQARGQVAHQVLAQHSRVVVGADVQGSNVKQLL